jgi:hypothetical protein
MVVRQQTANRRTMTWWLPPPYKGPEVSIRQESYSSEVQQPKHPNQVRQDHPGLPYFGWNLTHGPGKVVGVSGLGWLV